MSYTAEDSEKDHIYTGDNLLEALENSILGQSLISFNISRSLNFAFVIGVGEMLN